MIARILHMFTSFMTARFEGVITSSILMIVQNFLNRGRQAMLLIFASFVFSILFAAGIIISLLEASSQYDTKGFVFFSAMLASSLTLSALSLVVLAVIFWPRRSLAEDFIAARPQTQTQAHTPLEELLAVAINEGVQYFKERKAEHAAAAAANHHTKTKSHSHVAN